LVIRGKYGDEASRRADILRRAQDDILNAVITPSVRSVM
jgi:hypothetical protein